MKFRESLRRSKTRHLSVAHDRMQFKATSKVSTQLQEAVDDYCKGNDCKGYAALATGQFPLIKDARTINRRLNPAEADHITIGKEKSYYKIKRKKKTLCVIF